jgi:hypothetical protein
MTCPQNDIRTIPEQAFNAIANHALRDIPEYAELILNLLCVSSDINYIIMKPLTKKAIKKGLRNTLFGSRFSNIKLCGFDYFRKFCIAKQGLSKHLPKDVCNVIKSFTYTVNETILDEVRYYRHKSHERYLCYLIERKMCNGEAGKLYNKSYVFEQPFTFDHYYTVLTCDICGLHYCVNDDDHIIGDTQYIYPNYCALGCTFKCDECDHVNTGIRLEERTTGEVGDVEQIWFEYCFDCKNCGSHMCNTDL